MDSAEPAVGHQHDDVAGRGAHATIVETMSSISGMWRAWRPCASKVVHELLRRKPLRLGQTRAKHGGDDDFVGCAERLGEVVLKDAPADEADRGSNTAQTRRPG